MGFCRRCGEITDADRCKCGGTSKESSIKPLFAAGGGGDKWSQRYLSKSPSTTPNNTPPAASPRARSTITQTTPSRSVVQPNATGLSSRPASPSKLSHSLPTEEEELASVFGSILSPKDNWCCVACSHKFVQEEVIYPHPDAKTDKKLAEVYFCRPCFAERFSKGTCKKCKCAVLSDAPFIKHEKTLWHDSCYSCSYCTDPETSPVIDFAGNPSCEDCFDREAYKSHGVPPSPHLSQSPFKPATLRPAPSKWGGGSAKAPPATIVRNVGQSDKGQAWRVRSEREKSPMVASYEELGDKLRKAGLEDRPAPAPMKQSSATSKPSSSSSTGASAPTSSALDVFGGPTKSSAPSRWSIQAGSPARLAALSTTKPATPPAPAKLESPTRTASPLLPTVPRSSVHPSLKIADTKRSPTPSAKTVAEDRCHACSLPLGYGEFIQLPSTGAVLHRGCFRCGGCNETLDGGNYVNAEEKVYHQKCAPAPRRYRTIVTSLAEPSEDDSPTPSPTETAMVDSSEPCQACGKELTTGHCITIPKSGKTFHKSCFSCASCSQGFGLPGQRSFVEVRGLVYHPDCAPAAPASPVAPRASVNPLRTSTSRALPSLPPAPSQPKIYHPPPSSLPSSTSNPSIFATRVRPPANLGGLLICSGCSVRATERETVQGPLGRRYHAKCLTCGMCKRQLDSESRMNGEGQLRCESCRKTEARSSYRAGSQAVQRVA